MLNVLTSTERSRFQKFVREAAKINRDAASALEEDADDYEATNEQIMELLYTLIRGIGRNIGSTSLGKRIERLDERVSAFSMDVNKRLKSTERHLKILVDASFKPDVVRINALRLSSPLSA